MVDVQVQFSHVCADDSRKEWSHEFSIKKGTTIRKLKQVMLLPKGTKEDADKFELRRGGRRVPDYEQVWKESKFDFNYLGAKEGARRAALDDAREAGTADEEICLSGRWSVRDKQGNEVAVYTLRHEPGAETFHGDSGGFDVKEGKLDGKAISWKINEFSLQGRVEDKGRTIADLRVMALKSGAPLGTFEGARIFDASCWTRHPNYDLRGRGDVEQMDAKDLDLVRRRVEKMGYAGFSVWQGRAYIKGGGKPLTREDLDYGGDENPVVFYLFTPPDPYGEALAEEPAAATREPSATTEPAKQAAPSAPAAAPTPAPPAAAAAAVAEQKPKAEEKAEEVEVVVKHALADMASQITVKVMSNCKLTDVRRAAMEALGENKMSEVRLVKKTANGFQSLDCEKALGQRRELLSMGRSLKAPSMAVAPPAPAAPAAPATPPVAATPATTAREQQAPAAAGPPRALGPPGGSGSGSGSAAAAAAATTAAPSPPPPAAAAAAAPASPVAEPPAPAPTPAPAPAAAPAPAVEEVQLTVTTEDESEMVEVAMPATATIAHLLQRLLGDAATPAGEAQLYVYDDFYDKVDRWLKGPDLVGSIERQDRPFLRLQGATLDPAAVAARGAAAATSAATVVSAATADSAGGAKEEPELEISVVVDRDLGIATTATVRRGSTIRVLKEVLSAMDLTGEADAASWSLGLPQSSGVAPVPLADSTTVTEEHLELELIQG